MRPEDPVPGTNKGDHNMSHRLPLLILDKLITHRSKISNSIEMVKAAGFHVTYERLGDSTEAYFPIHGKEHSATVVHPDPEIALQNAAFQVLCEGTDLKTPVKETDIYKYIDNARLLDPADTHLLVPLLDSKSSVWKGIAILIIDKDE
jgi:hypothetical protein